MNLLLAFLLTFSPSAQHSDIQIVDSLNRQAALALYANDPTPAIQLSTDAYNLAQYDHYIYGQAYAKFIASEYNAKRGAIRKAYWQGMEALELMLEADTLDNHSIYRLHRNQSVLLSDLGHFEEAANHAEWAIPYVEMFNITHPEISKANKLDKAADQLRYHAARYWRYSGAKAKGDSLLLKMLDDNLEINDSDLYARTSNQLGMSMHDYGMYQKAIEYYTDALKITAVDDKFKSHLYNNLALTLGKLGQYDEARKQMARAIHINQTLKNRDRYLFVNYKDLAEIMFDNERYTAAINALNTAENIFPGFTEYSEYIELYRLKEKALYGVGEIEAARVEGEKFDAMFDDLMSRVPALEAQENRIRFEIQQSQLEVQRALAAERLKFWYRLAAVFIVTMLVLTALFFVYRHKKHSIALRSQIS
ncbi:tetratricopeptide repeat protein [Roseivirga pacifica]|uniref:tetratricopeptide repeat protein n=1 Tax=Roseivirga pacifica TaxID=1267423 RepID=UPI002095F044|nr:tetratricopeptide repeat protein [Roseivirga pacifica]MCO6367866.1 tetratricopeptide repeat protein [Roseivirga pacifica]MCO6377238.1 tetratricopeptide repeat protein [Roseivirga pacifica]